VLLVCRFCSWQSIPQSLHLTQRHLPRSIEIPYIRPLPVPLAHGPCSASPVLLPSAWSSPYSRWISPGQYSAKSSVWLSGRLPQLHLAAEPVVRGTHRLVPHESVHGCSPFVENLAYATAAHDDRITPPSYTTNPAIGTALLEHMR
jgi:hypothetical protein